MLSGKGCWRFGGRMSVREQRERRGTFWVWERVARDAPAAAEQQGRKGDIHEGWWEALPDRQPWVLILPMSPVAGLVLGDYCASV